jgi:deazaflavin-dependent oxidoreductase (nitroreductase family)
VAIPRFVRPFTKHIFSPVFRPLAAWLPWFGVLTVAGRRSGRRYSTPLNVFHHRGEYVFALTYGSDVNWVQNVLASGTADLRERGRTVPLTAPRLFKDPKARAMPFPVRPFLRLTGVAEFLAMRPAGSPTPAQAASATPDASA